MELLLLAVFQLLDLFFFYFCFEAVLIPMFLLIGQWGSRERRITAAYYFFLYTLITSMCVFVSIFYLFSTLGTTLYPLLSDRPFSIMEETYLAAAFFITFGTKIPMFPFHIWLPEAHVEAPTVGSVILASLLLKLGGFGFLRYSAPLFTAANWVLAGVIYLFALLGVLYASMITIRQMDLKRIIAYSSVAHMNLAVLGIFAFTQQGLDGAVYLMLGHGLVSGALFICIGVLYDRYHTRLLHYYNGLATVMPLFAGVFFVFTAANMGFPGTVNFVAEFLIYVGVFDHLPMISILATPALVLSAVYSIWLYNRVMFGPLKISYLARFTDLSRTEASILLIFVLGVLYFGLATTDIIDPIHNATKWILVQ
jgi:proton-translocating NADH-quinone oxidoreductase chain M